MAPLFNYGPYNTQGLVTMHIPQPYHGTYMPADQSLWNRASATARCPLQQRYPPHAVPIPAGPQPYIRGMQPAYPVQSLRTTACRPLNIRTARHSLAVAPCSTP